MLCAMCNKANTATSTKWATAAFNEWILGRADEDPSLAGITAANLVNQPFTKIQLILDGVYKEYQTRGKGQTW